MIDIKRILCPIDFSSNSDLAAGWGRDLAARFGAELHVLYVMASLDLSMPPDTVAYAGELVQEIRESSAKRLDEAAGDSDAIKALREGSPAAAIVEYAEECDIDLIVMGTHGRTGLSHLLIGSVAEKVVRRAPCAVLTVRPDGHDPKSVGG